MRRGLACCINPQPEGPGNFWSRFSSSSPWYASIKLQGSSASFGPPRVFYFPGTRHIWWAFLYPPDIFCQKKNSYEWQKPDIARSQALVCAPRLLRFWVWIPTSARKSASCDRCVLSSRGICVEMIPRQKESYRVWCDHWWWSPNSQKAVAHYKL